ncbi:MAG: DUF58 domain-containing protein [Candidatus Nanohaloarchaeota archaeon]|nr:DUF58 domain-containing protein [Candidatus Nanohaloarchaeota archaeon]
MVDKSSFSPSNTQPLFNDEVKKLIIEINTEVKKIIDLFRIILKYKMVLRGRGIEFADIRKYLPTDDASLIDWKVSARMSTSGKLDRLFVKVYEEERDLDVILLIDASATMDFGTQERLKREYVSLLAGTLSTASIEAGDKVGMVMFNDTIKYIPPERSDVQTIRILAELVKKENWKGGKNLAEAINFALKTTTNRSFLFIISDFISIGDDWIEPLRAASVKFDGVLGIMIRDVRDSYLPKGVGYFRLKDPITGKVTEANLDKIKSKFEKLAKEQEEYVEKKFHESGAGFVKYYTNENFVKTLIKWFDLWGTGRA